MKKSLKIYIAGHNGFLGRNIKSYLSKKNFDIFGLSRNELDLTSRVNVQKALKKINPDIVINAAGRVGGIRANINNNAEFLDENYLIQSNLILSSYKLGVKRFINIASSCIYPTNSTQPIKEEYLLNGKLENTNEGYALAKIAGLKLCEYLNKQYNFDCITLIPCNLYGEEDKFYDEHSHFLPGLITKIYEAYKNELSEVKLWGSGSPRRELIHVNDLSRAIYFFLDNKKKQERIINIGTGKDHSIKEYADMIKKQIGYEGNIIWDKSYPDGMKKKLLDVKLMKKIGFHPKINFEKGLTKVINDFKKNF